MSKGKSRKRWSKNKKSMSKGKSKKRSKKKSKGVLEAHNVGFQMLPFLIFKLTHAAPC
jgi:hypothetical protein